MQATTPCPSTPTGLSALLQQVESAIPSIVKTPALAEGAQSAPKKKSQSKKDGKGGKEKKTKLTPLNNDEEARKKALKDRRESYGAKQKTDEELQILASHNKRISVDKSRLIAQPTASLLHLMKKPNAPIGVPGPSKVCSKPVTPSPAPSARAKAVATPTPGFQAAATPVWEFGDKKDGPQLDIAPTPNKKVPGQGRDNQPGMSTQPVGSSRRASSIQPTASGAPEQSQGNVGAGGWSKAEGVSYVFAALVLLAFAILSLFVSQLLMPKATKSPTGKTPKVSVHVSEAKTPPEAKRVAVVSGYTTETPA